MQYETLITLIIQTILIDSVECKENGNSELQASCHKVVVCFRDKIQVFAKLKQKQNMVSKNWFAR